MTPAVPPTPLAKTVVLLGAGHANLVFVRRWGMTPLPGVAVTLVSTDAVVPYSALVPAYLAGECPRDAVSIDLVRFCRSANVRFLAERCTRIDTVARALHFADRPALCYDALALAVGSVPAIPAGVPNPLPLRPLPELLAAVERLGDGPIAIVGGGASGCELAVALHRRRGGPVLLLQANERLLPRFPARAGAAFAEVFRARGIDWRPNARVIGGDGSALILANGERVPCAATLWATQGSAPALLQATGLPTDAGFVRVSPTLQSDGDAAVFATGDCASHVAYPDLPRNGVHAVRQGAVLFDNVAAFLREQPLRPFRPQSRCLYLLNTGDGDALLNYGPFALKAGWARRWKDRIDRRWIAMLTPPAAPMLVSDEPAMRCGGCGSKVPGDVLSAALKQLDEPTDPRVLLGARAGEDAAVFRLSPSGPVEVQTVDYFKSFTDDPYLFGRVAALHAVSDLYAMNARPFAALAIATLPFARGPVQEAQLSELLAGSQRSFRELGVTLAGGHTTEGHELALGFSVTGLADEAALFRKSALQPGDRLVLTKPLGTGALLAAWMRAACRAEWYAAAVQMMLTPNRAAAETFARHGIRAVTDITGFGLAGHLLEMLDASGVGATLTGAPLLPGFVDVVATGIVSTLHADNAKLACRIEARAPPAWLFDPQTSGGLLAGVPAERVAAVLQELPGAAVVGEVTPQRPHAMIVVSGEAQPTA